MHVAVFVKQVLDQEIPPHAFRIDRAARRPDIPGAVMVMSLFDSNALEVALKLRDEAGNACTVTAISIGAAPAEDVLRKALAATADRAVLVADDAIPLEPGAVAAVGAAVVRRLGADVSPVDLVVAGRQAGDWEHGQTGGMIAERLGWPCVGLVAQMNAADGGLLMRRETGDTSEKIAARFPLVASITNDATNRLRLARVRDVLQANRKPIVRWSLADLGVGAEEVRPQLEVVDLFVPERESNCEMIDGESAEEKGRNLALRLRELGVA